MVANSIQSKDQFQKALELYEQYKSQPLMGEIDSMSVLSDLQSQKLTLHQNILVATLLSDARILQHNSIKTLEQTFEKKIIYLLLDIIKLNTFSGVNYATKNQTLERERVKLMLLAMIKDTRILFVKLAYRSQRLSMLRNEDENVKLAIAKETMEIYVPLANRFGLAQLKSKLEDKSFRCIQPEIYYSVANQLDLKQSERNAWITNIIKKLKPVLDKLNIEYEITGRPKHIYSIWKKMHRKKLELDSLYDLMAIRVYVKNTQECYSVLGILHTSFKPIPYEFDDYIANPKQNGYQSIHTVLIYKDRTFEVQVRTHDMHQVAEFGIAAHWQYKEQNILDQQWQHALNQLQKVLTDNSSDEFLLDINKEINETKLFVLTEKNEIVELISGATPLDFAYHIHTEIGHGCRACYVNNEIQPLNYILKNGEKIKIVSVKNGQPKREWLGSSNFIKTHKALSTVRSWFNKNDRKENSLAGEAIVDKLLKRFDISKSKLPELIDQINYQDQQKLFEDVGKGLINEDVLSKNLLKILFTINRSIYEEINMSSIKRHINGTKNMPYTLSICCRPKPQQDIVGLVTFDRKIEVHRINCSQIDSIEFKYDNKLLLYWSDTDTQIIKWKLKVSCYNTIGSFKQIIEVIFDNQSTINTMEAKTDHETNRCTINLTVEITEDKSVSKIFSEIENLTNVIAVELE